MMTGLELPKGWDWTAIGDVCQLVGGSTPRRSRADYFGGSILWITPSDLDIEGAIEVVTDSATKLTQEGLNSCSARLLPIGTVLYSSRATIGKVAIAGVPLATNQGFANLVCGPRVLNRYVAWCLRASTPEIRRLASSTTYPEISKGRLREFEIPLPNPDDLASSLETQRRIVTRIEALFGELQAAREVHQKVVEDTGRLMAGMLAETFDANATRKWPNENTLGNLVEINAPLVDPRLSEYRDLPHIHGQVIEEGTGWLFPYRTAAQDGMRSSKYLFSPGSVLYSKIRPYLRKVTIVDFEGLCSADMYPLEIKTDEIAPEFLMWALLSPGFTTHANSLSGRARMPKLNRKQLFSYSLRYPARLIQDSIAHYLLSVRDEIVEIERTGDKDSTLLDQMEQAILAQAFRREL